MRGTGGFTLIELLVSAAILGLILTLGAGGLRFGARVWEVSASQGTAETETRALRRFLRAVLAEAQPLRPRSGTRTPPVLFDGRPTTLRIVAPLPARLAPPGPQLIDLTVEPRGGALALVMRWTPIGVAPPAAPGGGVAEEVLAGGLRSAAFRYGGPGGMRDTWQDAPALPALVEIDLAFAPEGGAAWPTLAAPLRLARGAP